MGGGFGVFAAAGVGQQRVDAGVAAVARAGASDIGDHEASGLARGGDDLGGGFGVERAVSRSVSSATAVRLSVSTAIRIMRVRSAGGVSTMSSRTVRNTVSPAMR